MNDLPHRICRRRGYSLAVPAIKEEPFFTNNVKNLNSSLTLNKGKGSAVIEIDLGSDSAEATSNLLDGYDEADLSGPRLLHAARRVARVIYMTALPETRDALAHFANGQTDVVIVHNLFSVPTDLELTPNAGHQPSFHARVFALGNAGLGLAAGQLPVAVSNENLGQFDRHVRPVFGQIHLPSSTGAAELGPHTEHAFRNHGADGRFSPQVDSICLAGMRNDSDEPTGFAAFSEVMAHLRPPSIDCLASNIWGMDPPNSSEARDTVWGVPILYWRHGRIECAYRADKVHIPDSAGAYEAIHDLSSAISKASRSVVLRPGTAWLARNPRCLHWRDEVKNPTRWLLRTFGIAPCSAAVFVDPSRPELIQY